MSSEGINWGRLAEWAANPARYEYQAELQQKIQAALAAREQQQAAAASSDASPAPATEHNAPASAPSIATAPSLPRAVATPKSVPELVTALAAALDAVTNDAERTALLAAAPRQVREQLNARLTYLKLIRDSEAEIAAERGAYAAFSACLDLAEDDAARLAIIRSAAPAFVAKWREHITDTQESARRRYLQAATGSGSVDAT